MRGKYTLGSLVLALLVAPLVAIAEPPVRSWNFELLGQVDVATGTPTNMRAYSKIAPWPNTDRTFLNTGCYESGVNPSQFVNGAVLPGCFRVVDVADPTHPKRIATVEVYDRVKSPVPPPPSDPYWSTPGAVNVWTDKKFDWNGTNPLTFSTACGDWAVDAQGNHTGPGWVDTQDNPTCWDRGWITRTHYTAGPSGDFKMPDNGVGFGLNRNSIYWVNSQRQGSAPSHRLGYTGVAFYDLEDPAHPKFLSRIDMPFDKNANGTFTNAGGVHHGFFDGRYAYLGAEHAGYIGSILVIVDALDPYNPKIVGKWAVPGQKTPEEDAIRNSTETDPKTGLVKGWIPGGGFAPMKTDPVTGLVSKDISSHYFSVHKIKNRDVLFLSWHQAGLIILDVTDRTNPVFLSRFDYLTPTFQANDKLPLAQDDYASCVRNNKGWGNQGNAEFGKIACGNAHSGKLVPNTNIFWLTDEYFTLPYGHLRFFDVSDLTKPKLLSHFLFKQEMLFDPPESYPKRSASTHLGNTFGKNLLFLAWYGLGVEAIDFSNPAAPINVGNYSYSVNDGEGGQATYDVIFDHHGNLVVSDSEDGVRVLRYTGPGSASMNRTLP